MNERQIESYFKRQVKQNGGIERKFVSPGVSGVPDRICGFSGGIFAFVELKAPGKRERPSQAREHKRWRDLDFKVFVLDSKEAVDEFICEMKGL